MAREKVVSSGRCSLCGGVFDKAVMTRHLRACQQKTESSQERWTRKKRAFHLLIEGRYLPQYWMHVLSPADATLGALDLFLRDIWLECCDHMSEFEIDGRRYTFESMDFEDESMEARLGDVLSAGMKFTHAYDFGSTTYLKLKVVSEREGLISGKKIRLLARNEPPVIPCGLCGRPATRVCMECAYSQEGWLCDECAGRHECGDEMLLPVVNSPRTGVCAYAG